MLATDRHRPNTKAAPSGQRPLSQLADGFRYVSHHRGVRLAILLVIAIGFLGNPIVQLAPVFAERIYDVGAGAYGLLTAAFGVGAASGIWVMARAAQSVPRSSVLLVGTAVLGIAVVCFGLAPVYVTVRATAAASRGRADRSPTWRGC